MKLWNTAAGLGAAALALLSGTAAHAQAQVVGAGSSAVFNAVRDGAVTLLGGAGATTTVTGSATLRDATVNSTVAFVLVYENTATAPGGVRRFVINLNADSTVGNRALFNGDTVTIQTAGLPADLATLFSGSGPTVNVAFTDVRPEDALNATVRALTASGLPSPAGPGLGLSNGQAITDIFGGSFPVVLFNLRTSVTTPIGAAPVVVFINNTAPTLSGSSDPAFANVTNVNRFTLANILNGSLGRTSDLEVVVPNAATPKPLTAYIREPLSGTYNTMEFCIPQSVEVNGTTPGGSTQELNVDETTALNEAAITPTVAGAANGSGNAAFGGRVRAIGTGQMISAVSQTPYSIGYAFYSVPNFTASTSATRPVDPTRLKYLTVEGCDPIQDAYSGGAFTAGGSSVTLANVANGAYPVTSLIRAVTLQAPTNPSVGSPGLLTLLSTSIPGANNNKDFVNANSIQVFRSHRGAGANNGAVNPAAERGSDVGGAVFLKTNEVDFNNDTGSTLTGRRQ